MDGTADLTITPRVIDTGDEIISLASIARVSQGADPEKRRRATYLFIVALAFSALATSAIVLGQLAAGVVLGFLTAVVALVAIGLRNGEALFIGTSDGKTTILIKGRSDVSRQVFDILRTAMEAEPTSASTYYVHLEAGRIDRHDGVARDPAPTSNPARRPPHDLSIAQAKNTRQTSPPGDVPTYGTQRPVRDPVEQHRVMSDAPSNGSTGLDPQNWFDRGRVKPTVDVAPRPEPQLKTVAEPTVATSSGRAPHAGGQAGAAGVAYAVSPMLASRSDATQRPEVDAKTEAIAAFDEMVEKIAPQYGDRFNDVREWLAPVRSYLGSGQGNLAEAQARWSIFAKEHLPALASVDPVPSLGAKIGKGLGLAP